jgi:outer membrane protein TolC
LDLNTLVREATESNPEIRAARQRWEVARAVVPQVQTLPDPRLLFGYQRMPMVDPPEGPFYGVGQEIPFPGKLRQRGAISEREAEQSEQEYEATRFRVIARLKQAYYDLHFIHKSIEIVLRNKEILMQFQKTAEARYSVGKAAQQDVFRAQVEVSRVLDRLAVLEQQKESLHAEINRLLNWPPAGPLGTPEEIHMTPVTRSLADLSRMAEKASPVLLAAGKRVKRGEEATALARLEFYPDFELSARGTRNERINDNGYEVMLGIRIPLYFQTKQREGVRQALSEVAGARETLSATSQELLFLVKDAYVRAERADRLVKILKDAIIPQATLALQSAQSSYGVGKVDFLTLLNSLLTLQENELELHGEMVEHEKALARLEETVGGFK